MTRMVTSGFAMYGSAGLAAILALATNWWIASQRPDSSPILPERSFSKPSKADVSGPSDNDLYAGIPPIQATFSRPLFRPSRRPFIPKPEPIVPEPISAAPSERLPPEATAKAPQLVISGIQITPSQTKAMVTTPDSGNPRWVGTGDFIDGWVISTINRDGLTLSSENLAKTYSLYPDKASADE